MRSADPRIIATQATTSTRIDRQMASTPNTIRGHNR